MHTDSPRLPFTFNPSYGMSYYRYCRICQTEATAKLIFLHNRIYHQDLRMVRFTFEISVYPNLTLLGLE